LNLKTITRGGIIAAMYVVLTVTPGLNAGSFSGVQFRVSKMLMPLAAPLFVMLKKNPELIGLEQRL